MIPGFIGLFEKGILGLREKKLAEIIRSCSLCPRRCGTNRLKGEHGFCNLSASLEIQSALPHFGEEPPISGEKGAGAIFFTSCNMRCIYCQNYQLSHLHFGRSVNTQECAEIMLDLQDQGCHNVELISGTPHLAGFFGGLIKAAEKGFSLPLVYNCGGYESIESIKLLQGVIDIYMPDFKYAPGECASFLSGVSDYGTRALEAIGEMIRQVGDGLEVENEIARKGIIIRHLVLPGMPENSFRVLRAIRETFSASVPLSIMSQYTPIPLVKGHPFLGRKVTQLEYDRVVNKAMDLGFEYLFIQEGNSENFLPDFSKTDPFGSFYTRGKI